MKRNTHETKDTDWVIDRVQDGVEIQLSQHAGDAAYGCAINVRVNDVDGLYSKFIARGLDTTRHHDSPVHRGPVDQKWAYEFYVMDPDGNTLRFGQPIR